MTSAQLARVAMILGALLLLWGAVSLARRGSRGLSESDRFALPALTRDSVDSVLIVRAADTVRLGRRDSAWTVNGHPASETAIQELFGALADTARRTELVGARPASHGGFGVDSAKGVRIRIVRGDSTVVDLVQGNRGPSLDGGYFRLAADSTVYLVGGNLAQALEQSSEEWRDRTVARVAADSVALIEVTRGRRAYTIRRDSTTWSLVPGGRADSAAVAELLAAFRDIEAAGFASPAEADSAQLARPDRRVRLLRRDGTPLVSLAFDSAATGFWVQASGDSTVYRLDTWTADRLAPADTTLKAKPAAS